MKPDRVFTFATGALCGYGMARGWGVKLMVLGAVLYVGGTLLLIYEEHKRT